MNQLVRFDTTALNRALIGFDRIFTDFENRSHQSTTNYPPYNVIKYNENSFEIQLAVAGFSKEEIVVEVDQDQLTLKGYSEKNSEQHLTNVQYLHRGLAARDFSKSFTLAEHVTVKEVELTNGILCVKLTREVPEALKPRIFTIK